MSRLSSGWFVLPCLALAGVVLSGRASAGDYYSTVPFTGSVFIGGTGATPAEKVIGKEYSHNRLTTAGDPRIISVDDHNAFGVPDPLQNISWDGIPRAGAAGGNSGSTDAFDYGTPGFNYPAGQVDAIANRGDFLFNEVIGNKATLIFSTTLDIGGPAGSAAHVIWEDPVGGKGVWADIETISTSHAPGPGPGVNHHDVFDLDGLEVWGPEPPSHSGVGTDPVVEGYAAGSPTADADRFSLDSDMSSGVSVWAYDIPTKFITPWVPHAAIVAAVESAFLPGGGTFPPEIRDRIDVDAMMAHDVPDGSRTGFGPGDELLFSIDPIDEVGIDGGEIIHMSFTAAGGVVGSFLFHGGHLWDTAFDVHGTFGTEFEDVDAIEAVGTLDGIMIPVPDPDVPEPQSLALAAVALLGWSVARRT